MLDRKSLLGSGLAVALTLAAAGTARADEKTQLEQRVKDLESQLAQVKETLRGGYFTANSDLEARVSELERMAADGGMSTMFKNGYKSEGGDGAFTYQFFGLIQNDWAWYWDDADNYSGTNPGTDFRRIRVGTTGQLYGNVKWWSELDFAHGDVNFADMWIELAHCTFGAIRVGHMKEPIGFDQYTGDRTVNFMERSTVNSLSPGRNTGIMLHGLCSDDSILYQVGMFRDANGAGDDIGNAKAGEYNFAARIATRPIIDEPNSTWLHVGASARLSDYSDDTITLAGKNALNQAPTLITNTALVEDGWQAGLEACYVAGPVTLLGEWAQLKGDGSPNLDADALSLEAAYWLTGETTGYDKSKGSWSRNMPKSNFGDGDSTGAWQVALRYDTLDVDADQDMARWTFGVNWLLNPHTRVQLNVCRAEPDTPTNDENLTSIGLRFEIDF